MNIFDVGLNTQLHSKQDYMEMLVDWEVTYVISKKNPQEALPGLITREQRAVFSPHCQPSDPAKRMKFPSSAALKNPNFLLTAGEIRRRKDKKYGLGPAHRLITGCWCCQTVFSGAEPPEELGHLISTELSSNLKLNVNRVVDVEQFRNALQMFAEEGRWVHKHDAIPAVPHFRWVESVLFRGDRVIPADEICYYSSEFEPTDHHLINYNTLASSRIQPLLLEIFKR